MAAAAPDFRISTLSMSAGLMSAARFGTSVLPVGPLVDIVELSIGVPSTTNNGCPVPWIVLSPRILIDDDAPGDPDCCVTTTPGAFAASAETTLVSFDCRIAVESTGV